MWRWLIALLFFFVASGSAVLADDPLKVPRAAQEDSEPGEKEATKGNDALPYTIAVLSTAVVMIVIVKPSRKL